MREAAIGVILGGLGLRLVFFYFYGRHKERLEDRREPLPQDFGRPPNEGDLL